MSERRDPLLDEADDAVAMNLLRMADPREAVADTRTTRVRAAVRAEWQTTVRRRASRRRMARTSAILLAAAAAAVFAVRWFDAGRTVPLGEVVAVVQKIDGDLQAVSGLTRPEAGGPPNAIVVRVGAWIETHADARLALRFEDGTSVRLDVGSRVRALSTRAIELAAGAVYVDTGSESVAHFPFEVRTAVATARDVGTQFEVRLVDRGLRLRVRTGIVELTDRTRSLAARAGTEIAFSSDGAVSRPVAVYGPDWEWMTALSREFTGETLAAFLDHVCREQGWSVRYSDAALAEEAAAIVLHGSLKGLPASEAVAVAIATSNLDHRLDKGELVVFRRADRGDRR